MLIIALMILIHEAVKLKLTGSESGNLALYYIDIANIAGGLTEGEIIWIQIITAEGYEDTVEITVSA